jgi:VanZ family protein
MRNRVWLSWLPVLIWMAVIYYFSDVPNSNEVTKAYFGGFNYWIRKSAHIAEYAVLFGLTRFAARTTTVTAFVITVLYACTDEWHQSFVFGRSGTPTDVLVDAIGPALVILAMQMFRRRLATD